MSIRDESLYDLNNAMLHSKEEIIKYGFKSKRVRKLLKKYKDVDGFGTWILFAKVMYEKQAPIRNRKRLLIVGITLTAIGVILWLII